jgi:hypothetical protein
VPLAQEGVDGRPALVPLGLGRHADHGVLRQQRHHRIDVVSLERLGEAHHQLTVGLGDAQPLAPDRHARLQAGPGALQRAVDRGREACCDALAAFYGQINGLSHHMILIADYRVYIDVAPA